MYSNVFWNLRILLNSLAFSLDTLTVNCKLLNLYGFKRCLDHRHPSSNKRRRERNSAKGPAHETNEGKPMKAAPVDWEPV